MNKVVQELAIKTFSAVYSVVVTQIVYEGLKAVCYKVQESKKIDSFLFYAKFSCCIMRRRAID